MFTNYLKRFFGSFIVIGFWVVIGLFSAHAQTSTWVYSLLITGILASYFAYSLTLGDLKKKHETEISEFQLKTKEAISLAQDAKRDEELWKKTLLERNSGFPSLLTRIQDYEKLKDEKIVEYLRRKSHPAYRASEVVKEQSAKRRQAEFQNRRTQAWIEMYEQYAPFLIDLREDLPDVNDISIFSDYTDEERQDSVVNYLTKEEYRKLSTSERNQLALDRFWKRPKSKWLLGKLYERFIGYHFEQQGYEVEYFGIVEKYKDMGRDLICHKGNQTLIIQCKNWAQFKTIYEKHIFQLFGTTFEYQETHPDKAVEGVFYTTTQISPLARKIATALKIKLNESIRFDQGYPCIKCNINQTTHEKIYHLPFDQKYDDTKIDRKGELYCKTVKEAEEAGFRRAFRWRGNVE